MHVAGSRSTLCNKNVGPVTLHPLYHVHKCNSSLGDVTVWLDHDTISSIESLVVKGLFGRVLIVGINPSTGI